MNTTTKTKDSNKSWKAKNKKELLEKILTNEQEIDRINKYMESFFTTDDESRAMTANIASLETKNRKLRALEPSELSPESIMKLTSANLPDPEGYLKKHHNNTFKIAFTDETVSGDAKARHAVWKLVLNEWQYQGYE